jgi:hypothetical protein
MPLLLSAPKAPGTVIGPLRLPSAFRAVPTGDRRNSRLFAVGCHFQHVGLPAAVPVTFGVRAAHHADVAGITGGESKHGRFLPCLGNNDMEPDGTKDCLILSFPCRLVG